MKIKTTRKPYKGYIIFPRAIMLLFQKNNSLDFNNLGVFLAFASECDWDRRHPTYGCLTKPDDYLANKWGCNLSTIWRNKQKLKRLGFLSVTELGYFRLSHIEWFDPMISRELAKHEFANSQELIAKTQELIATIQGKFAHLQDTQVQKDPESSEFPSKENLGFSERELGVTSGFSEEDAKWVAENVFE